jgi:putative membrane protein
MLAEESWDIFAYRFAATIAYVILGLIFFAFAFWVISKVSPYSMKKEIEDEKNSALAIIIGAVIIGISIIIAAAIHG